MTQPINQQERIDISIVIVNYNVKEFVANLLRSIEKASSLLRVEVILVDNASIDGSVSYLSRLFPKVTIIANATNVGFGRANNQGFAIAKGKYIFILNPDTLLEENSLNELYRFLETHQTYAAVGCKLLNPDGTFAPESRRQEPSPLMALGRTIGLTALFPKNKRLSGYYMNWLDPDEPSDVEVLSGACMFYRASVLKELAGFDEQFFMYGEDIDLCRRTRDAGYKIGYIPSTSIIHYKGESTKKDNIDYIIIFNKAMYQYFQKHYSLAYSLLFRCIIVAGIIGRGVVSYLHSVVSRFGQLFMDVSVMNALIIPLFIWRYDISLWEFTSRYDPRYLWVNALITLFYVVFGLQTGVFRQHKYSLSPMLKSVSLTFIAVIVVSFFLKDVAFSRLILVLGAFLSMLVLGTFRFILRQFSTSKYGGTRLHPLRVLLVGYDSHTSELIQKMRAQIDWHYEIVGILAREDSEITEPIENVPMVGSLKDIARICSMLNVDQIIYSAGSLSNNEILQSLTKLEDTRVQAKVIPESKDYIIGKSHIEYFDDVAIMDVDVAIQWPLNRLMKRCLDLLVSTMYLLISLPFWPIVFARSGKATTQIHVQHGSIFLETPYEQSKWINRIRLMWYVWCGALSLVGAPLWRVDEEAPVQYKPGLTGLRQINERRVYRLEEKQRFELHYVKFYSIWLDLDILLKTLLGQKNDNYPL